jgi:hypothetical protein
MEFYLFVAVIHFSINAECWFLLCWKLHFTVILSIHTYTLVALCNIHISHYNTPTCCLSQLQSPSPTCKLHPNARTKCGMPIPNVQTPSRVSFFRPSSVLWPAHQSLAASANWWPNYRTIHPSPRGLYESIIMLRARIRGAESASSNMGTPSDESQFPPRNRFLGLLVFKE